MTSPLFVLDTGGAGQPPVLWLHGALVAGWMWTEQIHALQGYRHLVPDLPGVGQSADAGCEDLDAVATSLIELCRDRCGDQPVHLVGLSLGAVIGLRMLSHAPDRFARVVLSGPLAQPLRGPLASVQSLILMLYRHRWSAALVARLLGLPEDVRQAFLATAEATPAETYTRLLPELYRSPLPATGLDRIGNPVLLVTGDRDTRISRDSIRVLLTRLANARGCWADGLGHQWNAEDGARFSAMVAAWLGDRPLPAGLTEITGQASGRAGQSG